MCELNQLALLVASPVEDYFVSIDRIEPEAARWQVTEQTHPLLAALGDAYATHCEGAGFYALHVGYMHVTPHVTYMQHGEPRALHQSQSTFHICKVHICTVAKRPPQALNPKP
jgi:hypothetical protein